MWSFFPYFQQGKIDVMQFVEHAKKLEVDGVELLDFFWKNQSEEMPAVKARLEEMNLPVSAYAVSNNFVQSSPDARSAQVDVIKRGVDSALFLGTRKVRVFAGDLVEGITFDKAFNWIVGGLTAAARYAERHGVILALENHGRLAGKGEQIRTIIDEVGSEALRANVDTGNFLMLDQNPVDAVRQIAALTASVHLKDLKAVADDFEGPVHTSNGGKKFLATIIGEGDIDLNRVAMFLKGAGYKDYMTIEYEGDTDCAEGVAKSVAFTRQLIAKIGA
jgi:sugar phosphate isomerase/epimerase